MAGLKKLGNCTSESGASVTFQCSFALFPDDLAILSCPTVTNGMFHVIKNEIGSINADRRFEVNRTFATSSANGKCDHSHLCNLRVSNGLEMKTTYTEYIYFQCRYYESLQMSE